MSSFSSVPNDILMSHIFSLLPIDDMEKLCLVNTQFSDICHNETLWMIKSCNEFPVLASSKPQDISWKQYYGFLLHQIPLYYNGDRIAGISFDIEHITTVLSFIVPYIEDLSLPKVNIVFINQKLESVVYAKYPSFDIIVTEPEDKDVKKIVLITDLPFRRGRRSQPKPFDKEIIYKELTSHLSHLPIYGYFSRFLVMLYILILLNLKFPNFIKMEIFIF